MKTPILFAAMAMIVASVSGENVVSATPATKTPMHVAFMMDDGPSDNTLRLLEILKKENVRISFDLVGQNVAARPELARAIAEAGHQINNHSMTHTAPVNLDDAALEREIVAGQQAIIDATGVTPKYYWPPYLAVDPRMEEIFARNDMTLCAFPITPRVDDWDSTVSAAEIHSRIVDQASDGATICLHETRKETVDEMAGIIADLRAMGCVFLTYDELVKYRESVK